MRLLSAVLLFPLGVALAAPPVVKVPDSVPGEVSAFVVVRAEVKDGKGAKFVPLDAGLSVFPPGLLSDPDVTVVVAAKAGKYRLLVYSGNQDGASDPAYTTVVIGGGGAPIGGNPPPVKPDEPKDPPAEGGKFFFVLVRPDGPVPPAVAASVRLGAWDEVRKGGHQMKDYPVSELPKGIERPATLPAVVVLRVAADGKSSSAVKTVPLPTTDEAVKELLK